MILIIPFQICMEAHERLTSGSILPDVIFLDINMPGMSGDACLCSLRSQRHLDDVKIVMFSTYMPSDQKSELLRLGATFAFEKPAEYRKYRDILKQILT